jgi:signal transduction histidine kinase
MATFLRPNVPFEPTITDATGMAQRLRTHDWALTPLGVPESWPAALGVAVDAMIASSQPMLVVWGRQLTVLYNDAFAAFLYNHHPDAFAAPAPAALGPLWTGLGPWIERARRGTGGHAVARPFITDRSGFTEEVHLTFSCHPLETPAGRVEGVLSVVSDVSAATLAQRRLVALDALTRQLASCRPATQIGAASARAIDEHARADLPFALIYQLGPGAASARLTGASGVAPGSVAAPRTIQISGHSPWSIGHVTRTREDVHVTDLAAIARALPLVRGTHAVVEALVVPLTGAVESAPVGVLVAGLNPLALFDAEYRRFIGRVADRIGATLAAGESTDVERQRSRRLFDADRARNAFLARFSEELRNPLTLLLTPLEDAIGAVASGESGTALAPMLTLAHQNGVRLFKLANALRDFARVGARRTTALEPTDLAALTADLAATFRPVIERAGLEFDVSCEPLPTLFQVDREMWETVVANLLSNAFKFTFDGYIAVALTASARNVVLTVTDTGVGIPSGRLEDIFTRFHRADALGARSHDGAGIGLALVRELVEMHDGEVSVTSTVGRGSTFSVRLPAEPCATLPEGATALASPGSMVSEAEAWLRDDDRAPVEPTEPLPGQPRILLVEPDRDMRAHLAQLLSPRWHVVGARDGPAALRAIGEAVPDLVLGDLMVPVEAGPSLIHSLRQDPRTIALPMVIVSTRAGEEARIEGMEAGADDYVVKPFGARELRARVAAHLELARTRSRIQQALRDAHDALQAELSVTTRLHEFTARLLSGDKGRDVLDEFLEAIVEQQGADAGTLELANRRTGRCELVARTGPIDEPAPLDPRVYLEGRRVLVEDSGGGPAPPSGPDGAGHRRYRAWQSTPLLDGAGALLGVISTYFARPHGPTEHQLRLTDVYARVAAVIFERQRLEGDRQDLLRQLMAAQEAERCRISRELHDTIAQHMAGLMLGLSALRVAAPPASTTVEAIEQLQAQAELVSRQAHDLALELRPSALDDVGLSAALSTSVTDWSATSGVHADFHATGWDDARRLPLELENAVYRIVLEALANVQRHANAHHVSVILERRHDHLLAIVEDDGRGFPAGAVGAGASGPRLGLIGMKERAALVGGALSIESGDSGTTVFVRVPLAAGS